MEVAQADAYPADFARVEPGKWTGRKWSKHWVPQETILGTGSCFLLKWVTEDILNKLYTKPSAKVAQEPKEELEVVYLCTFEGCRKIFPDATALRRHAHIHGEKQYICHYEGCGKRFMDSSKLKRHFLIHTGEKQFICPFEGCGKAFSLDFNLRSHMRSHTGERYHVCPYEDCGKRYAHEYKLKAHVRSSHSKNIHVDITTYPLTDPERDIIIPRYAQERGTVIAKYVPERETVIPKYLPLAPAAPPAVVDKPFACPFEGCSKRYIHEYKLNLHFKNAHMMHEVYENGCHPRRGGGMAEEDIQDESDHDGFQEVVPKYYEQIPKVIEHTPRMLGVPKAPGKGMLRIISKPAVKGTKRKQTTSAPLELNFNLPVKQKNAGRNAMIRQELSPVAAEDSEETEEEDDVKHSKTFPEEAFAEEDDEETEDDIDVV